MKKISFGVLLFVIAIYGIAKSRGDWRKASRESANLAPLPRQEKQAVVQIYAARTVSWRGVFSVHTWIATKEKDAAQYTTYQVIGWRLYRGLSVVLVQKDIPDRRWFGSRPTVLMSLVGAAAESAIPKIQKAAAEYPYPHTYYAWPGPNSNSFTSFIVRRVPEFGIALPSNAIGKDWINKADFFARTESGTGMQFSLYGILGLSIGKVEGLEFNILGLDFGVDILRPALNLPLIGRVGMAAKPEATAN